MLSASLLLIALIAAGTWMLLHHLEPERDSNRRIISRIDELLPQTQCQECGYAGCLPYAEAIVLAGESIDRCPPGGQAVRRSLAELLGQPVRPPRHVDDTPVNRAVVIVNEPACIGCTKCIEACPVDAIVGAAKQMHTVIASRCTGCGLCIAPCPVDCIDVVSAEDSLGHWRWPPPRYTGRDRRGVTSA